jgi:Flp pilus assembly protein TadD
MALPPPSTTSSVTVDEPPTRLIRRQLVQLAALIGIVIAAFFATRALAASNRATTLRDAAEWYRRGHHELAAGHVPPAIEAFRRASIRNRSEKRYTLALARALALNGDTDAARAALVALRAVDPDDHEVNLELARLAGPPRDPDAPRYYRDALAVMARQDGMDSK